MKIKKIPRSVLVILSLAAITFTLTLSATAQIETVLYSFPSLGSNGANPDGGLIFDSAGNMYGVTELGGQTICSRSTYGCGVVYEMSPNGTGGWMETPLYAFTGLTDGNFPTNNLVMDAVGNLYGVTVTGGDSLCNSPYGCGVVFELTPGSSGWTETVLHTFTGGITDGTGPNSLIGDAAGNLYGTTALGGVSNSGTVFKLSNGSSGWTESVLFSFDGAMQGSNANGLALDSSGNLYGTTGFGGNNSFCHQGCGVVFKLSRVSGRWLPSLTHVFHFADGAKPASNLVFDAAGNLYGTAQDGGAYKYGAVFEIQP